jgi:membrane protease YdiL (CAAX protease family)
MADTPKVKIALFLTLTILFSAFAYWRILAVPGGALGDVFLLMWSPGLAAMLTRLITQRNLRGERWGPGRLRLLGAAFVLPLLYAGPVYLLVWLSGIGGFDPHGWDAAGAGLRIGADPFSGLFALLSWGMVFSLLGATGEELGWRGLLVPELAKLTGFRNTSLISGAVWAAWHMPLIVLAGYHGGATPLGYSIACFTIMVMGLSFLMTWLRFAADSVWPCALLHASHNLFIQGIFDDATVSRSGTAWITGEFGAGLAVMALLFGWWALRRARRDGWPA